MTDVPSEVPDHFSKHWMTWLSIRHFLPAIMLRNLARVVVNRASGGGVELEHLFEEANSFDHDWNDSWLIRPRKIDDRRTAYFQRLVRAIVWQNDDGGWPDSKEDSQAAVSAKILEFVTRFGAADFSWPDTAIRALGDTAPMQDSFAAFLRAFATARTNHKTLSPDDFWAAVRAIEQLDMPLGAIIVKHLSDLCADSDAWRTAFHGYCRAQQLFEQWNTPATWKNAATTWCGVTAQSRAGALRIIEGMKPAALILKEALNRVPFAEAPLLFANMAFDKHVFSSHPDVDGMKAGDDRPALLHAPLLHETHDDVHALHYSLNGKYEDAHRRYWAVLRRQLALGSSAEAAATKVRYAQSLLRELSDTVRRDRRPESFQLALKLLIEGSHPQAIGRISWSDTLVDAYVDEGSVRLAVSHAGAFDGCRRERELVCIELFREWIGRLAPSRADTSRLMWEHVANVTRAFPSAFEATVDVGRRGLRVLKELAEQRPEMRSQIARAVSETICERLRPDELWWGKASALETAAEYVDVLSGDSIQRIIGKTLSILEDVDPAKDVWPLVRPALQFLVTKTVKHHARGQGDIGRRILEQILRFGNEQESEQGRLLFYLHDFEPGLIRDPAIAPRLEGPLRHLRERAGEIQSSRVTETIHALLLALDVAGYDGARDALTALIRVLESAKSPRESPGLPFAYDALLLLAENPGRLREQVPGHDEWFTSTMGHIVTLIAEVWEAAIHRPLLFAPFAFPPPTKPDPVIVHNWAFASMQYAEAMGASDRIGRALAKAAGHPDLTGAISLARATRSVAGGADYETADAIRADDRESFYAALGRRLVRLQTKVGDDASSFCAALVEQCLRFGPRELDTAVLLSASRLVLHEHVRSNGLRDYARRLQNRREHQHALRPVVDLFWTEKFQPE